MKSILPLLFTIFYAHNTMMSSDWKQTVVIAIGSFVAGGLTMHYFNARHDTSNTLRQQKADDDKNIWKLEEKNTDLTQKLTVAQEALTAIQTGYSHILNLYESHCATNDINQQRIVALQKQLTDAQEKHQRCPQQIAQLTQELEKLRSDLRAFTKSLETAGSAAASKNNHPNGVPHFSPFNPLYPNLADARSTDQQQLGNAPAASRSNHPNGVPVIDLARLNSQNQDRSTKQNQK